MKYNYTVKHDGILYKAGAEVPAFDMPKKENVIKAQPYTKTEINRMSTEDLRKLATEQGIENAEKTSGAELKKLLIEKFGL